MNFDAVAAGWDTDKRSKRAKIIAEEIAGSIRVQEGMNALEFGCGTGLVSFFLQDRFRHITLIDTSEGMIDTLSQKIRSSGIHNMTGLQMDISKGSVSENAGIEPSGDCYDVIYTSMAMHHIKNTETTLKSLYQKLKMNGQLCIVDLTEDDGSFHRSEKDFDGHNGFDPKQLGTVMESVGFKKTTCRIFYEDTRQIEDVNVPYALFILAGEK